MEVHHHSHTARKKWTHYFWEFLMLFLAVFCGFFAEYQLEHKIEKERAKQYIFSFYEDLKTDTANFTQIIRQYEVKELALNNARRCFDHLQIKQGDSCLAELVRNAGTFPDLVNADQTLQQLKNAGGLRLLKKSDADSVMVYDKMLRDHLRPETTGYQDAQNRIREMIYQLTNYKAMNSESTGRTEEPFMYSANPELLNRFFVALDYYTKYSRVNKQDVEVLKEKATNLIRHFKNKYRFK